MEIPVLIEPIANDGFRAKTGEPLPLSAEGNTRDEAMRKLRELLADRLQNGTQLLPMLVRAEPHPLVQYAGMFENNSLFDEWQAEMAEYRRQINEDPNAP